MSNSDSYSVEQHGDGYAIYHGRSETCHGYNLGNVTEPDIDRIKEMIRRANRDIRAERRHDPYAHDAT